MKKITVFILSAFMSLYIATGVFASPSNYFIEVEIGDSSYWQYIESGEPVQNQWVQNEKGNWYYAGADGKLLRNTWLHDPDDGKYYYLGDDWAMLHDTTTPDGYTVGSDGAWVQ